MAYTPNNNPYIPGDPYSYDLKWLVCKINQWGNEFEALNERVANLSTDFDNLKQYVEDSISDDSLRDLIAAQLEEMLDNGTLAGILNDAFPMEEAIIQRYGRILDSYTENHYLIAQSICYDDYKYYTCGNVTSDNSEQMISVWNSTGENLAHHNYTALGHGNDIAYLNDRLYVATGSSLAIVHADTLEIIGSVARPSALNTLYGVCADKENNIIYFVGNISGNNKGIGAYHPDTDTTEIITTDFYYGASVPQTLEYHDGYLYLLYLRGDSVAKFSLATKQIEKIYTLPTNDGYFWTGEKEKIFMKDGIMCIWSISPYDTDDVSLLSHKIGQIFYTNIVSKFTPTFYYTYSPAVWPYTVTVDEDAERTFNPLTTFTALEEINGLVNPRFVRIEKATSGYIWVNNKTLTVERITTAQIDHIRVEGGDLFLQGVTIGSIRARSANVTMANCTVGDASLRFCNIRAWDCSFTNLYNLEKSILHAYCKNAYNIGCTNANGITTLQTHVKIEIATAAPEHMQTTFTNLQALVAQLPSSTYVAMQTDVYVSETANLGYYHMAANAQRSYITGNSVNLRGAGPGYLLNWTNASTTLTIGGAAATASRFAGVNIMF